MVDVPPMKGKVDVSPDEAYRLANSYLTMEVAMAFQPGQPILVWGEQPVWRMPVNLHLGGLGKVATLGVIDVDAVNGEIHLLSVDTISDLHQRADALAARFTPTATPA